MIVMAIVLVVSVILAMYAGRGREEVDAVPTTMPSAAMSWRQIGNSMYGIQGSFVLGERLRFLADGNTVVASSFYTQSENSTFTTRWAVIAYTYNNQTNKWKQLGQSITSNFKLGWNLPEDIICLFLGLFRKTQRGGLIVAFGVFLPWWKTSTIQP
jgi:hypothetical protein